MYLQLNSLILVYQAHNVSTLEIMGSQNWWKLEIQKNPVEKQSQTPPERRVQ